MTRFIKIAAVVLAGGALLAGPGLAQDGEVRARPQVIEGLYACQSLADAAARLACFDAAVERIKAEEAQRTVIFADREQLREAKRGLFGLGNIRLGIFGGGDDDPDEERIEEIEANVRSVTQLGRTGKLMIVLEDGARWQQTDTTPYRMRDFEAKKIKIKSASMGSFIAQLDGGRFFKIKRVQ